MDRVAANGADPDSTQPVFLQPHGACDKLRGMKKEPGNGSWASPKARARYDAVRFVEEAVKSGVGIAGLHGPGLHHTALLIRDPFHAGDDPADKLEPVAGKAPAGFLYPAVVQNDRRAHRRAPGRGGRAASRRQSRRWAGGRWPS